MNVPILQESRYFPGTMTSTRSASKWAKRFVCSIQQESQSYSDHDITSVSQIWKGWTWVPPLLEITPSDLVPV